MTYNVFGGTLNLAQSICHTAYFLPLQMVTHTRGLELFIAGDVTVHTTICK